MAFCLLAGGYFHSNLSSILIVQDFVQYCETIDSIREDYFNSFADDGYFWGQQFQEEQVKEYKMQDQNFIKWARQELKDGNKVFYSCSW